MIELSGETLAGNIVKLRGMTDAKIMAVLKNNGYGMGLTRYACLLSDNGIDSFAVSRMADALALRQDGIRGDILLIAPIWDRREMAAAVQNDITLSLAGPAHANAVMTALAGYEEKPHVHIKIDSGMHRFGFTPEELPSLLPIAGSFRIEGTYTHFSRPWDKRETDSQHDVFIGAINYLQDAGIDTGIIHCCASKSFLHFPGYHHDMVRLGTAMLGLADGLTKIFTIKLPVSSRKTIKKGEHTGYGAYRVRHDTEAAIISSGCADGLMLQKYRPQGIFARIKQSFTECLPLRAYWQGNEIRPLPGAGVGHLSFDIGELPVQIGDLISLELNPLLYREAMQTPAIAGIYGLYNAEETGTERMKQLQQGGKI